MSEFAVQIRPLSDDFERLGLLPRRMSDLAAGFDLCAALGAPETLLPGQRRLIPCGFAMAFAAGFEAQVRPRSGLALKHGVTLLNSPGTIDADYRGEVKVILVNLGQEPFVVQPGERVGQLVFAPVFMPRLNVTAELVGTARGNSGFGSTGT